MKTGNVFVLECERERVGQRTKAKH